MNPRFFDDHILDEDTGRRYAFSCPWFRGIADTDIPEFLRRPELVKVSRQKVGGDMKEASTVQRIVECRPSQVDKYTGQRKPRCNQGRGCQRCWDKFNLAHGRASPSVQAKPVPELPAGVPDELIGILPGLPPR